MNRTSMKKRKKNIVVGIIFAAIIGCLWMKTNLSDTKTVKPIESVSEEHTEYYSVKHTEEGFFLLTASDDIIGPFSYIFADELEHASGGIARYISNGKYGYIDKFGNIISDPIYVTASVFGNRTAKVQETFEEGVYYINELGYPITKHYIDGADNFERQGLLCRVMTDDGKYAIINRNDQIVFSGADSIEPLLETSTVMCAIINDKASIFDLDPFGGKEIVPKQIAIFDYNKISMIYGDQYACVFDENKKMGIVDCYHGNTLLPADYKKIEFKHELDIENGVEKLIFLAQDDDGKIHVYEM